MHKKYYPLFFAIIGMILVVVTSVVERPGADGHTSIPLLALLAMCEIGFFCALAGAFFTYKASKNLALERVIFGLTPFFILAVLFALNGLSLWPQ